MEIYEPDTSFEFDKITLANPQPIQGGFLCHKNNDGQ